MSIYYDYAIEKGKILYFCSTYCVNDERIRGFNQHRILAEEIVSFDTGLFKMLGVLKEQITTPNEEYQYLAVIIDPPAKKNRELSDDERFEFVGYDLVEEFSFISAITDCGGDFEEAIDYSKLNEYGIISDYEFALATQKLLEEKYPDEDHAYCDIVEIWRYAKQ